MYLKVFVTPSAKNESIEERGGALAVSVKEPAEGNRANTRVRELVAAHLGKRVADVRVISGHHTRGKMLSVRDE